MLGDRKSNITKVTTFFS